MTAWDAVTCGGYLLTVRHGLFAGTTHFNCLCGWQRNWPTRSGATREVNKHLVSNGYPRLKADKPAYAGDIAKQKRPRR